MNNAKLNWQHLVTENPMLIEITRFRRKFLSFSSGPATAVAMALALMGYLGLVAMVFQAQGTIAPSIILYIQLAVMILISPALLHNSIAGERERRSWDFLLVAPLTKAQIVFGKFIGAMVAQAVVAVLFFFPLMVAVFTFRGNYYMYSEPTRPNLGVTLVSDLIAISFGMTVGALSMLFSARSKRGFTALGTTNGVLAVFLVIIPVFIGMLGGFDAQLLLFLHPFVAIAALAQRFETPYMNPSENYMPLWAYGLPQIAINLALTAVLLVWATKTLIFAENEVKFLPKRTPNA